MTNRNLTANFIVPGNWISMYADIAPPPHTLSKITTVGQISGFADLPGNQGLAFDGVGNLFVAYGDIYKVAPDGTVSTFLSAYTGNFNGASYITFDKNGNMFATSADGTGTIYKITPNALVNTVATGFVDPTAIACDINGNVYVATYDNNSVSKITPGGAVSLFATSVLNPKGLAFDNSGNLYSSDVAGFIYKIATNGSLSTFATFNSYSTSSVRPTGLAFDGNGNLFATTYTGGLFGQATISRITTNGVVSAFTGGGMGQPTAIAIFKGITGPTTVNYTVNATKGLAPLAVQFNCPSTDSLGYTITNWQWSFGDGTTSMAQAPSHSYGNLGTYYPVLTGTNSLGWLVNGVGPQISVVTYASSTNFAYTTNNGGITITRYIGTGGDLFMPPTINGWPIVGIASSAFWNGNDAYYAPDITSILFPNTLTTIGYGAFTGCADLKNLVIPNSVISIGSYAFDACTGLTNATFGTGLTSLGTGIFFDCPALATVTLPNTLTNIGTNAFYNCTNLTSLIIPATVRSIQDYAFLDCTGLKSVYFIGNAPTADSTVFYNDTVGTAYYLPNTTGWGATLGGLPTAMWNPQIQTGKSSLGLRSNQFGFNVTGNPNNPIVIEASTNLFTSGWTLLFNGNVTNGQVYFSDPSWTNYPKRFYRIRTP
jgi:PKD repeat protein